MLEKLGLPSKPSNRGAAWVVDASHCQGCSGQFTFINRKHHCRRCGGLFCNSCTQQRMVLRGQGDSPVRICGPCKQLEEAARFELRYGHKNRAPKGNTKQVSKHEEEVLSQIIGTDKKHPDVSYDSLQKSASSASSSSLYEESSASRDVGIPKSLSVGAHANTLIDIGSTTPEELRQQAVEQKQRYRVLKGEGKSEEALQAFKNSKELERQAGALELALRKNRRMASKAVNTQKPDDYEEPDVEKLPSRRVKEGKDDLASELRELGWSDADLHDATDNKPSKPMTLEGELSNLLGEMPRKSSKGKGGIDKTQVVAHKKKALALKREGKLAEAKEELKKAKVLEKQIEEQELLGEAEESDDELSALIRSMDDDEQDGLLLDPAPNPGFNFDHLLGAAHDFDLDGNFEVTDADMNNPELAAALKSFGWSDEEDSEASQEEVLALKREALTQKREGNVAEAMTLLKRAKLLEKDLKKPSTPHLPFEPSEVKIAEEEIVRVPPKSKLMIQRELLGLKKKALALRREGRVEEAEEELRKGKILEQQLEEMENAPKTPATKVGKKVLEPSRVNDPDPGILDLKDEAEAEVTEQDMHDPSLLSVLENLGWNDDDQTESVTVTNNSSKERPRRSKAEVQKELLASKRKALTLRRQGKVQEAEGELERAKALENEMADIENANSVAMESHSVESLIPQEISSSQEVMTSSENEILSHRAMSSELADKPETAVTISSQSKTPEPDPAHESDAQKAEILAYKRKAIALKREGKLAEAREALRHAKLLEKNLEDSQEAVVGSENASGSTSTSTSLVQKLPEKNLEDSQRAQKPMSGRDRFKLQQESLSHKRNALKLRREGKIAESEAEFELAKALESQLEELGAGGSSSNMSKGEVMDGGLVEDLLDPQLMSALKSIGWGDAETATQPSMGSEPKARSNKGVERDQLEEQIKAEKLRALNLKRAGNQAEALESLRAAKRLEKQLGLLAS